MTTAHHVLVEARKLIADPEHWTRRAFARTGDGREVPVLSREATCFCALGAITRTSAGLHPDIGDDAEAALTLASQRLYDLRPEVVNDIRPDGHASVLAIYDAAILDMETTP